MPAVRSILIILLILALVSFPVLAACSCSMPWLQQSVTQKDQFNQMKAAAAKPTQPIDLSGFSATRVPVSENAALKSRIMVPQAVKTVLPTVTRVAGFGKDLSFTKLKNRTFTK